MGTIAEKLTYLDETREKIRKGINSIGGNLTNTDTFRSYSDALDGLYEKFPKVTGTGNNITLEDTMEASIKSELQGDTSQASTPTPTTPVEVETVTGGQNIQICKKNLYAITSVSGWNYSSGLPNLESEFVVVDSYNTNNIKFHVTGNSYLIALLPTVQLKPNTQYTISYTRTNTLVSGSAARRYIYNVDDNGVYTLIYALNTGDSGDMSYTFTTNSIGKIAIAFGFNNNSKNSESEVNNLMIEEGTSATTYEAYNGTTYELNLGKNLFDKNNINVINSWFNDTTPTISSTADAYRTVWIPCLPNTKYTISKSASARFSFGYTSTTPAVGVSVSGVVQHNSGTNLSITTGADAKYLVAFVYHATYDTLTPQEIYNSIQIERNVKPTTYSAYKTPIELCKIGDYKDRIFRLTGKNLFESDYILAPSTTINAKLKAGTYIISTSNNTNFTNNLYFKLYDENETLITTSGHLTSSNTQINFSTSSYSYYGGTSANGIIFTLDNDYQLNIGLLQSDGTIRVMLNEGSTALSYEPYGTKGTWYIEKNIGKVILNGSEVGWTTRSTDTNTYRLSIDNLISSIGKEQCFSNYFNWYSNMATNNSFNNEDIEAIHIRDAGTGFGVRIDKTIANTTDKFKTWLSTHNTIVYYPLATPTYTEITDSELLSQLGSFGEAQSYVGITNINVDGILPTILNVKALENIFN